MRSIRLSLAVYFLALLALALAAVSVLAYRNTEHVLGDKEAIRRAMLSGQFDRDRKAEEVKLDRALSWQGNGFIYAAQISYRTHTRPHHVSAPFGVLSIGLAPTGLLVAPVWLASGSGPLADSLFRDFVAEFHYEGGGAAVHPPPERQPTEYFQINFEGNALWKSGTLGANTLPFDRAAFGKMEFGPPQFEDIQLESGIRVRRIMMKATFARFFPGPPRRGMPGPTRPGMQGPTRDGSRRTFGRDTNERASPVVLFQCGVDTSHRDAR